MRTEDENKMLRKSFWSQFKQYSNKRKLKNNKPGKWIMNDTGIKQLHLKFHFDEYKAQAGIEVETRNIERRLTLFEKLESLKTLISQKVPYELQWELEYQKSENKTVSFIFASLKDVSIYKKTCWRQVFVFLFNVMDPLEEVFLEYREYLK